MRKRAVIYCRISKDRVGAGLGVERQEADCRALAERFGFEVVFVYVDNDMSATSGKPRPGYLKMLDAIQVGGIDVVIAWHTDRLHRSNLELEEYISICEPRGVVTHTVKAGPIDLSTPSGRMVARQLCAVARYEVEHKVERIKAAKLQSASNGQWSGGRRPFGWEHGAMRICDPEAHEIRQACQQVLAGSGVEFSLRAIVRDLNARGIRTSTGREWRASELRKVLIRPRNAGLMVYQGKEFGTAKTPAIIDEETWRTVRAVLTNPERRTPGGRERRWLGSGLYRCGVCGATLLGATAGRGGRPGARSTVPAYRCKEGRQHVVRNAVHLDRYIEGLILKRIQRPDIVDLMTVKSSAPNTGELHTQASELRDRLAELGGLFGDGVIDARQLREGTERLRARLTEIEERIPLTTGSSALVGLIGVSNVEEVWAALDLSRKRVVLDTLMTVTVKPAPRGRPAGWRQGQAYFDPSSIVIEWKV